MSLFHSILSQLQEKITKETTQTETVASIVSKVMGTAIAKEQITVQGTTLRMKVSPTLKMAINLKKEKILKALQDNNSTITTIV